MKRPPAALIVVTLLAAAGCAPALREPPALEQLAGAPAAQTGTDLETRAAGLFDNRETRAVRRAAELYTRAALADPPSLSALTGAVRARIWLADHAVDDETRRAEARHAVQTAQWCDRRHPDRLPTCAYWLGAALGVQARERRSTALDALDRIVELFRTAAAAQPAMEHAGPDRALALLYLRAPGWPTGPGDPDLGLEHARRAVELESGYPPNQLALGEALAAVDDVAGSLAAYREAHRLAAFRGGDPEAAEWMRRAEEQLSALKPASR